LYTVYRITSKKPCPIIFKIVTSFPTILYESMLSLFIKQFSLNCKIIGFANYCIFNALLQPNLPQPPKKKPSEKLVPMWHFSKINVKKQYIFCQQVFWSIGTGTAVFWAMWIAIDGSKWPQAFAMDRSFSTAKIRKKNFELINIQYCASGNH
jgi:hypothetical protein